MAKLTKKALIEKFISCNTLTIPDAQKHFDSGYKEMRNLFEVLEREHRITYTGGLVYSYNPVEPAENKKGIPRPRKKFNWPD